MLLHPAKTIETHGYPTAEGGKKKISTTPLDVLGTRFWIITPEKTDVWRGVMIIDSLQQCCTSYRTIRVAKLEWIWSGTREHDLKWYILRSLLADDLHKLMILKDIAPHWDAFVSLQDITPQFSDIWSMPHLARNN